MLPNRRRKIHCNGRTASVARRPIAPRCRASATQGRRIAKIVFAAMADKCAAPTAGRINRVKIDPMARLLRCRKIVAKDRRPIRAAANVVHGSNRKEADLEWICALR